MVHWFEFGVGNGTGISRLIWFNWIDGRLLVDGTSLFSVIGGYRYETQVACFQWSELGCSGTNCSLLGIVVLLSGAGSNRFNGLVW